MSCFSLPEIVSAKAVSYPKSLPRPSVERVKYGLFQPVCRRADRPPALPSDDTLPGARCHRRHRVAGGRRPDAELPPARRPGRNPAAGAAAASRRRRPVAAHLLRGLRCCGQRPGIPGIQPVAVRALGCLELHRLPPARRILAGGRGATHQPASPARRAASSTPSFLPRCSPRTGRCMSASPPSSRPVTAARATGRWPTPPPNPTSTCATASC